MFELQKYLDSLSREELESFLDYIEAINEHEVTEGEVDV